MKKNVRYFLVAMLFGLILLGGCSQKGSTTTSSDDKITVIATFYPMYDFAKNVVGDEGEVELLIPAGTEPHDYEPSAKDIAKITDADVFVYNSNELETWVEGSIESIDQNNVTVIEAASAIQLVAGEEEEEDSSASDDHDHDHDLDPHVWLDPVLAQKEVETIRDALIKKYPAKKEIFEENASAYLKKLSDLNTEYKTAFDNATNKTFVTQHAAFGYLAREYGLTQEAIAGLSPDQEPSPSRLAELKKYIEENNVTVIYFESTASSKVSETLAQETGVELLVLDPLESITEAEQKQGADYISVMKDNLEALKKSIN